MTKMKSTYKILGSLKILAIKKPIQNILEQCFGNIIFQQKLTREQGRRRGVVVATQAHILTVVSSSHTGTYIFMSSDFFDFCSFVPCPVP